MRFSAFVALRLFAVLFLKRFPAGVLAACSASRAARFGSDAGKNPCGWHGKDQSTTRRDRRSEAFVLDLNRSHPAGVSAMRDLAGQYHLSRGTIVNFVEQLMSEGYVKSRMGSGSYVSNNLP